MAVPLRWSRYSSRFFIGIMSRMFVMFLGILVLCCFMVPIPLLFGI